MLHIYVTRAILRMAKGLELPTFLVGGHDLHCCLHVLNIVLVVLLFGNTNVAIPCVISALLDMYKQLMMCEHHGHKHIIFPQVCVSTTTNQ